MEFVANSLDQALEIAASRDSLGVGYPVYIIPWGMGNISYKDFLCHGEQDMGRIWEKHIAPVQTPSFRRAHIIHHQRP